MADVHEAQVYCSKRTHEALKKIAAREERFMGELTDSALVDWIKRNGYSEYLGESAEDKPTSINDSRAVDIAIEYLMKSLKKNGGEK